MIKSDYDLFVQVLFKHVYNQIQDENNHREIQSSSGQYSM